jgi:ankyrin repeat protein
MVENKNVNVNIKDENRKTALKYAFHNSERELCAKILLKHHEIKLGKISYLHRAVKLNWIMCVELLLSKTETDVNQKNCENMSPLFLAVKLCRLECIKLLLARAQTDVNAKNGPNNDTALHCAVRLDFTEAVGLLLGHQNIDLNQTNGSFRSQTQDYENDETENIDLNQTNGCPQTHNYENDEAENKNVLRESLDLQFIAY